MPPAGLVIIPAFNEEASLPGVLTDLREQAPAMKIVVIDDGSSDATAAVARSCGADVVSLPFNLGIGGALRTGFRYAVRHGYTHAVQFDGDGQHDAAQIASLTAPLQDGADLVIGTRFGTAGSSYDVGRTRWGAMRLLRLGVRVLSGQAFTDTSSGFRAFGTEMLRYFAANYPRDYMDSVEALLLASYAGFRVVEVPVAMRERAAGTASNRNVKLVYNYLRLIVVMVTTMPLRRRARVVS